LAIVTLADAVDAIGILITALAAFARLAMVAAVHTGFGGIVVGSVPAMWMRAPAGHAAVHVVDFVAQILE
jgi:hypothetical protein